LDQSLTNYRKAREGLDDLGLSAGGSGIAPLMAMLRHRYRQKAHTPGSVLYSSRSLEDVIYRNELDAMARYEEIDNQDFKAGMRKDESERSKLNPKPKF
jgi:ferredoxin-NADP reductase